MTSMIGDSLAQMAAAAMRNHREGRYSEAESICRKILDTDPTYYRSIVHLSVLMRHKGAFDESARLADQAIKLQPTKVDGYIQLGLCLLGTGQPADAVAIFHKAISLSPQTAPLYHNLGMALENIGEAEEAKRAFIQASKLAPNDVGARLSLGSLLLTEEDVHGARTHAESAIKLDPSSSHAHLLLAKVLVAENNGASAETSIRRALELDGNNAFAHTMLGFRMLQKGDFAQAEESFCRSIDIDHAQGLAYFGITQARKLTDADENLITEMKHVIAEVALTLEQASYLHFGIAKAMDNLANYEQAMFHYDEAHRNAKLFRYGDSEFDSEGYRADMEGTTRLYTAELLSKPASGFDSNLPIFIVGMMRSGTTLTEQILSSHPDVGAAGENEFWAKRGHEAENLIQGRFNQDHATNLARQYCRELRKVTPGASRITDKLPGNYQRLGLIHLALPKAKIIHCRRHPIDTSLSIYFTANPVAPAFSHSKEGIAFAYRCYLDLMEHWRKVLPASQFYEVQYEDLVADPRGVITGMLEFLELEWNEACLQHDKNAKEVKTPSLWQVRQPIYSTSVARWKRYEPWLDGLRDLMPHQMGGE